MKIFKNKNKAICGVKYVFFAIAKHQMTSKYCYYINTPWNVPSGYRMIYKGKSKTVVLNKYTLTVLGALYTFLVISVIDPVKFVLCLFYWYFDGARNFIRDTAWARNERYFNWCNIFIITGLIVWLVLK